MHESSTVLEYNATIPMGIFGTELDDQQKSAIRLSLRLGKVIQEKFPEVADDYRAGLSHTKLVATYGIQDLFGIDIKVAQEAVRRAIVGYAGDMEIASEVEPYRGLIEDTSELERIADEHHRAAGVAVGEAYGSRNGKITAEHGTGVHGMSYEEKRKAGQKGRAAQGVWVWPDEQVRRAYELAKLPTYQRRSRVNVKKMAQTLNAEFYGGQEIITPRKLTKLFNTTKRNYTEPEN